MSDKVQLLYVERLQPVKPINVVLRQNTFLNKAQKGQYYIIIKLF